jgi:hypothetical protein
MGLGVTVKLDKSVVYSVPLLEDKNFISIERSIGDKNWLTEHLIMLAKKIINNPGKIMSISLVNNAFGYPPCLEIEMTELAESDK